MQLFGLFISYIRCSRLSLLPLPALIRAKIVSGKANQETWSFGTLSKYFFDTFNTCTGYRIFQRGRKKPLKEEFRNYFVWYKCKTFPFTKSIVQRNVNNPCGKVFRISCVFSAFRNRSSSKFQTSWILRSSFWAEHLKEKDIRFQGNLMRIIEKSYTKWNIFEKINFTKTKLYFRILNKIFSWIFWALRFGVKKI